MNIDHQQKIIEETKKFRYIHNYPVYPPYHKGEYLEEYFINFFIKNMDDFKDQERYFLPIIWTDYYISKKHKQNKVLQNYLNSLDKKNKYFTVTQHDDAIIEKYNVDILQFSAGGKKGNIWIPLICSQIENPIIKEKDIFASFVGSHTGKRNQIFQKLRQNKKYKIHTKGWNGGKVSNQEKNQLFNMMSRSIFSLCPRGYGTSSFRLYESMQFESIPVYISDKHCLPWDDILNWGEFSIMIGYNKINQIDNILSSYTTEQIKSMREKIKDIYIKYFTLDATCNNITRVLNNK